MYEVIKKKFKEFLTAMGYNVGDNWVMRDEFPYLNLRINGGAFAPLRNANGTILTITVDIFSTYHGEKEILQIVDNINAHLLEFIDANAEVMYAQQSSIHIIDDKETGPVRKHGIVSYAFTLAKGDEISG